MDVMSATARRDRFRALLAGPDCLHPASVHDPVSARLAEDVGFECGMLAGSTASLAVLGAPDLVLLTLTEFAEQARRIGRASRLPLLVDADHGYGNALNVMRCVAELEAAGAAGLTIEDTALPTAFGTGGKGGLVSLEEGVGKMRAALRARTDAALVVVGRTSAMQSAGQAEAVARVQAYQGAGVDAVFLTGVATLAQLDAVADAVGIPIILSPAPALPRDRGALAARGVRIALQGHLPFAATVRALYDTLRALREGTAPGDIPGKATEALMRQVSRSDDYDAWIADYLA